MMEAATDIQQPYRSANLESVTRPRLHGNGRFSEAVLIILLCGLVGCGSDTLSNRVAIKVDVQIGGQPAGSGSLAMRPGPGVQCPLIKIPVKHGTGELPQSAGPVPGIYRVTFRSSEAQASLTQQLSETGRVAPRSAGSVSESASVSSKSATTSLPLPAGDVEITVPNENPAVITVRFNPA